MTRLALLTLLAALAVVPTARAVDETYFRSPSGNIECSINEPFAVERGEVVCALLSSATAKLYPKVWQLDGWRTVQIYRSSSGVVDRSRTRVLAYGRSIHRGLYVCTSRRSGMTCANTTSKHGFFLSRERQRIF